MTSTRPDYWAEVSPKDFEYGRDYRIYPSEWAGRRGDSGTPVFEVPNASSSSSYVDIQARSNYEVIENDARLQDKIAYGQIQFGDYRAVIYRADEEPSQEVRDLVAALSANPILDEANYFEHENALANNEWHQWAKEEFIKGTLWVPLQKALELDLGKHLEGYEIVNVLVENNDVVDEVWDKIEGRNYREPRRGGMNFYFKRLQKEIAEQWSEENLLENLSPAIDLFVPTPTGALRPV